MSRNHWQRLREEEESFEFIVIKEPGIYKGVLCDPEIAEVKITGQKKYYETLGEEKPVFLLNIVDKEAYKDVWIDGNKYFAFTKYLATQINGLKLTHDGNHKYFDGNTIEVEVINKVVRDWRFYDITELAINSIKVTM